MDKTRKEYLKRINSVLDFIEKNLDSSLSLEQLSKKANYSPFHFHRVFSTIVGERLNAYINRKRLERIASILLVKQDIRLKELAFSYGFNNDNSFSRAFRKRYGVSPTTFKSKGKDILSKIGIESFSLEKYICSMDKIEQWIKVNGQVIVRELPEIKLAIISHIGNFNMMSSMFEKLMHWGSEHNVIPAHNFKAITIYHDNPNVTHLSKLRFSAGITINKDIQADGEIRPLVLEKGVYAIGKFEINPSEIAEAWKNMNVWVLENELEFRDGTYFEMYHNDYGTPPEEKCIMDICIPITRKGSIKYKKHQIELTDLRAKSMVELDRLELINFMKELRAFFSKEYELVFKLGDVYQGSSDFSYLSLTTEELKKQKLKFVIVLNLRTLSFSICLSGQNKAVRKKYWKIFNESDWKKYRLVESIDNSLYIVDHIIVNNPNFLNKRDLISQIELKSLAFMDEIRNVLEQ